MRVGSRGIVVALLLVVAGTAGAQGGKPLVKCPVDSALSGTLCMDKYEASVWRVPNPTTSNKALVRKIHQGKATAANLTAGGATQLGTASDDYAPCADNGQNCADDIYAVSLPGVLPSIWMTWFQAVAACENARKRLPTNAEWQAAVAGSPDPGPDNGATDCNTHSSARTASGARSSCVSTCGAFDMVGNLDEWVAELVPLGNAANCAFWNPAISSSDLHCFAGALTGGEPGALLRGGDFNTTTISGPFATTSLLPPSLANQLAGFRCAR